jgi:uncharacterized metal-binding protein
MNTNKPECLCGSGDYIVMSCSGASDLGELSDLVARKLSREGIRKMKCLAMAGAGFKKTIEEFNQSNILLIDGCGSDCCLEIAKRSGWSDPL